MPDDGDDRRSIFKEIKNTEECIQAFYHKIEVLENNLRRKHLEDDKRAKLEDELQDIRVFLKKNEKDLRGLHKENRKSFAFSATLIFFVFLMYVLYIMIFGHPSDYKN